MVNSSIAITVTEELLNRFVDWLKNEQGTSESTIRKYMYYLPKLKGFTFKGKEDVSRAFDLMKLTKTSYEALSRLFTFIEKKLEGYEELVYRLRKAMPRKPQSGQDTYIPPDAKIYYLRDRIKQLGEPYATIYNILVCSGCRIVEAYKLIAEYDPNRLVRISKEACRYHIDLERKSKNVLIIYLPVKVAEQVARLKHVRLPHIDTVEDKFRESGLSGKYLRKWFRQLLKKLRVDSEVIEFIQGRKSALGIGGKHYTDYIPLADQEYIEKIYPVIKKYLISR